MSELTNRAIAHITDQMMAAPNDYMVRTLEEYLTNICTTDAIAEKLVVEGKTLQGFIKDLWEIAQKRQKKNCTAMTSDEIIPMLEKYYNISEAGKKEPEKARKDNVIDVMDILANM